MVYILTKSRSQVRRHDAQQKQQHQSFQEKKELAEREGLGNPIVTDVDHDTPVSKKECLQMIDKIESEATKKEHKKAAQNMYMDTKKYS